jgi:hypothetical protein
MRWSELKRSSKGAGGKPRGWRPTPVQEFAERLKKLKPGERTYHQPARELTEEQAIAALGARLPAPLKKASDQIADEQRDYDRFVKMVEADPQHPENEAPAERDRFLGFYRAIVRARARVAFEKMDGWNGDRIEEFIN